MKGPGSQSLRKGRKSTPWASYLITKNTQENSPVDLTQGENPQYIINWFLTAQRKAWFDLSAFVVMPNHYHLVILLGKELSLSEAIGEINENSARLINRTMRGQKTFWQDGFHDHLIRPREDMGRYIDYTHMNPVKEGFVEKPEDWPFSSAHPKYDEVCRHFA